MSTLPGLPPARADRLALRFAIVSLAAFAAVGAAIHLLIAHDVPNGRVVRVDEALALGLVLLYATLLPLALRSGRTLREQADDLDSHAVKLSALLEQLPFVVWTTDTELRFTECIGAGLEALGLEPNELRGVTLQESMGTDDPEFLGIAMHRRALEGESLSYDFDWQGCTFQVRLDPLRAGDRIVGVMGAAADVTERVRTEQALVRLRTQQALILESAGEGILGIGIRGNATFVNPAAARMLGWEPHELLGRPVHAVFHHSRADGTPYPPDECPMLTVHEEGITQLQTEEVFWRRDGSSFPVEYVTAPLHQEGRLIGSVLVFRDITDRRRSEEDLHRNFSLLRKSHEERRRLLAQLVHAEEEERRRIAGDIHDDSLQLMAAVAMYLNNVRRFVEDDAAQRSLLGLEETTREAIGRLRHLLFELRPPTLDREGLAPAIRMYLDQSLKPGGVAFEVHDRMIVEPPTAARTILYRIATEALTNVRKHARAQRVDVMLEQREGGYLLRITDDGSGFEVRDAEQPRPGHLGVSAMRERAELSGGSFRVESSPGNGATVEVWVPVEETEEADQAAAGP